jgi:hypothetical protein
MRADAFGLPLNEMRAGAFGLPLNEPMHQLPPQDKSRQLSGTIFRLP